MTDFNTVLIEFLDSLVTVFPEVPALASYRRLAGQLLRASPELGAKKFLQAVGPHAVLLTRRDPAFFEACPSFIEGIDTRAMWNVPNLTSESRDIIWAYLNALYEHAAGTMLREVQAVLPPGYMSQVQKMAESLQAQLGEGQAPTLESLQALAGQLHGPAALAGQPHGPAALLGNTAQQQQ